MPTDAGLSTVDLAWHDPELDSALRALPSGELAPALDLLGSTRDQPDRRELCVEVLGQAGAVVLPALRAAATEQRDDADRMLLWGSALVAAAWFARGADDADHTTGEQFARLADLTRQARATLTEAARLAPDDAVPWSALMWCALGDPADDDEGDQVFAQVQARAPELFGANSIRLQMLSAKWYGSNEAALEFARAGRRDVPAGHPLLALIPLAHLEVHIGPGTQIRLPEQEAGARRGGRGIRLAARRRRDLWHAPDVVPGQPDLRGLLPAGE